MTTTTLTKEQRWNLALEEARWESGITIVENLVPEDGCLCCMTLKDLELDREDETTPYAYSVGIDGSGEEEGYLWDSYSGLMEYRTETSQVFNGDIDEDDEDSDYEVEYETNTFYNDFTGSIIFRHGHGSATLLVEAFRNQGFKVEWEGGEYDFIYITP